MSEVNAVTTGSNPLHATWERVAGAFEDVLRRVPDDRWSAPAPPEGWTTRDVERHLLEWVPGFLAKGSSVVIEPGPDVDVDPVGAWVHFRQQIAGVLAAPDVHEQPFSDPRAGDRPLATAIEMMVMGDVLIHTWDLARGAGLDVELYPPLVASMLEGMRGFGDLLVRSGQYGPPVPVPADASKQDQLLGLVGRDPRWQPKPPR